MKKIVTLSFDDGRDDVYKNAFEILKKNGLRASVHVITGWIEGEWNSDDLGKNIKPLNLEQIKELYEEGFEISSHGNRHITNKNDFETSVRKLRSWAVVNGKKTGFAVPRCAIPSDFDEFKKSGELRYVRVGRNEISHNLKHKFYHAMYKIFRSSFWYIAFHMCNINDVNNLDQFKLVSIPILSYDSPKSIIKFVDRIDSGWVIFMLHSIKDIPDDIYGYETKKFEKLVVELAKRESQEQLEVRTIEEVLDEYDQNSIS